MLAFQRALSELLQMISRQVIAKSNWHIFYLNYVHISQGHPTLPDCRLTAILCTQKGNICSLPQVFGYIWQRNVVSICMTCLCTPMTMQEDIPRCFVKKNHVFLHFMAAILDFMTAIMDFGKFSLENLKIQNVSFPTSPQ